MIPGLGRSTGEGIGSPLQYSWTSRPQCRRSEFDPWLGRYPGEGNGYPLQYSGLENCMNCIVHGFTKSWTRLSDFHFRDLQHTRLPCSFTISWSLLKLMFIELLMPSNHLIFYHPLLFMPSVFPSIRVFSTESALCIR